MKINELMERWIENPSEADFDKISKMEHFNPQYFITYARYIDNAYAKVEEFKKIDGWEKYIDKWNSNITADFPDQRIKLDRHIKEKQEINKFIEQDLEENNPELFILGAGVSKELMRLPLWNELKDKIIARVEEYQKKYNLDIGSYQEKYKYTFDGLQKNADKILEYLDEVAEGKKYETIDEMWADKLKQNKDDSVIKTIIIIISSILYFRCFRRHKNKIDDVYENFLVEESFLFNVFYFKIFDDLYKEDNRIMKKFNLKDISNKLLNLYIVNLNYDATLGHIIGKIFEEIQLCEFKEIDYSDCGNINEKNIPHTSLIEYKLLAKNIYNPHGNFNPPQVSNVNAYVEDNIHEFCQNNRNQFSIEDRFYSSYRLSGICPSDLALKDFGGYKNLNENLKNKNIKNLFILGIGGALKLMLDLIDLEKFNIENVYFTCYRDKDTDKEKYKTAKEKYILSIKQKLPSAKIFEPFDNCNKFAKEYLKDNLKNRILVR